MSKPDLKLILGGGGEPDHFSDPPPSNPLALAIVGTVVLIAGTIMYRALKGEPSGTRSATD